MTEKILTDDEAAELYGTTDADTGAVYPSPTVNNWGPKRQRLDARLIDVAMLANAFRVFPVDGNADAVGVRAGRVVLAGEICVYAGGDPAKDTLTDNDTTYLWANSNGSGGIEINSDIAANGWPAYTHLKLATITMVSGAITAITDMRAQSMLQIGPVYSLSIETQGDTGSASRIHIEGAKGVDFIRVRVCDDGGYADATNATIAAAGSTTLVETLSAGKDLVFKSDANGLFELDLTNGTAETVELRTGPAPMSPTPAADHSATLDVTHAAP